MTAQGAVFVAQDPAAAAIVEDFATLAARGRQPRRRRRVTVSVSHQRSTATLMTRKINIAESDLGKPSTLGVLAHEYAHHIDPLRYLHLVVSAVLGSALLAALALVPLDTPDALLFATSAVCFTLPLLLLGLGFLMRRAELRADALAKRMLGPDAASLELMLGELVDYDRDWLSAHPSPARRRAAIARLR